MKNQKLIAIPEQRYYSVRAVAIVGTYLSVIFLLIVIFLMNEVNRLYHVLESL
jgi:hypothetical protein